jgi:predicted RNase H-like HicB family nuclease
VIDYGLYDSDTSGRRRRVLVRSSALPGCYSQGETIDETLQNSKEAILAHLLALKEDQVAAPIEESLFIGRVQVEVV